MLIYPAVFYKAIEGGYVVIFPDFDNGGTEGKTIKEAMEMAQDYIGTWLYDDFIQGNELPEPTDINKIPMNLLKDEKDFYILEESFKTLVTLDMEKYIEDCNKS